MSRRAFLQVGLLTLASCAVAGEDLLDQSGDAKDTSAVLDGGGTSANGSAATTTTAVANGSESTADASAENGASAGSNTNGNPDAGSSSGSNGTPDASTTGSGSGSGNAMGTGTGSWPSGCSAEACAGTQLSGGETCASASVISRRDAIDNEAYFGDSTADADDDQDLDIDAKCFDSNRDHFFRVYLATADNVSVTLNSLSSAFDAVIKLYPASDCAEPAGSAVQCTDNGSDGDDESLQYLVTSSGWYVIVVDGSLGGAAGDDDYGSYTIDVRIVPNGGTCGC